MTNTVRITGRKKGVLTISLIKLVHRVTGMSMAEAKRGVDTLLTGEPLTLTLVKSENPQAVRDEITALGGICEG